MRTIWGTVGLGRRESGIPHASAAEVAAGNGKFDTTNSIEDKPTSPGDSSNRIAVDNRVLPFPAVPGRFKCSRPDWTNTSYRQVLDTLRFIEDAATHPSKPSDDFIVRRAVGLLRHG